MKLKNIAGSCVLVALSVAVALGLGEAVVRIKNSAMTNYDIEMWRYSKELKQKSDDPLLGHVHKPNSEAVLQSVPIRINSFGLRGGPVSMERKPDERRILFLGSSITLGWGVKEEDTMEARLEKRFREDGQNVTVLNAGIGNYNAPRYAELFLTRLKQLQPTDIVVHYFIRDAEELDAGGGNPLLRESELAMMLWIAWHHTMDTNHGPDALLAHYKAVYDPQTKGYIAMVNALKRLADYARENHIRIYLAMVPDVHNLKDYPFGFIHADMARIAEADGYRYIDLLPYFSGLTPQEVWAMPGDPHPNALGHKIMADALYPLLAKDH